MNFFYADRLAAETALKLILFVPQTDAAAMSDDKDVYLIERD